MTDSPMAQAESALRGVVNSLYEGHPIYWPNQKPTYNEALDVDSGWDAFKAPFEVVIMQAGGLLDLLEMALDELKQLKGAKDEPLRLLGKPDKQLTFPPRSKKVPTPPDNTKPRPGVPLEEIQTAVAERLPKPARYRMPKIADFKLEFPAYDNVQPIPLKLACGHDQVVHARPDAWLYSSGKRRRCYECIKNPVAIPTVEI